MCVPTLGPVPCSLLAHVQARSTGKVWGKALATLARLARGWRRRVCWRRLTIRGGQRKLTLWMCIKYVGGGGEAPPPKRRRGDTAPPSRSREEDGTTHTHCHRLHRPGAGFQAGNIFRKPGELVKNPKKRRTWSGAVTQLGLHNKKIRDHALRCEAALTSFMFHRFNVNEPATTSGRTTWVDRCSGKGCEHMCVRNL